MYIDVKDLPDCVQRALKSLEYHSRNIQVEADESITPLSGGGAGVRCYFAAVNLETGRWDVTLGSWGGANPWNPGNAVDLDRHEYQIPTNCVAIKGHYGYRSYAVLHVRPEMMSGLLPAPVELRQRERDALYCYRAFKGGQYRKEEMQRRRVTQSDVDGLVARGFIKVNKAGAGQITTAGRNAIGDFNGYTAPTASDIDAGACALLGAG